ncbi:MAG TPA: hypothetical protein VFK85_02415 [Anaeromyxobacteraceae bacterium]|nr:hypothetical protein [Anaeromyxobacteraceae bacterium]
MRSWMTRVAVVAALVGFAVPALACDGMKNTTASTTASSEKASDKAQKVEKSSKKTEAKKPAVASADAKR